MVLVGLHDERIGGQAGCEIAVKIAQFHQFGLEGIDLVHHMPTVEGPGVAIIQGNHVPGIFRPVLEIVRGAYLRPWHIRSLEKLARKSEEFGETDA